MTLEVLVSIQIKSLQKTDNKLFILKLLKYSCLTDFEWRGGPHIWRCRLEPLGIGYVQG